MKNRLFLIVAFIFSSLMYGQNKGPAVITASGPGVVVTPPSVQITLPQVRVVQPEVVVVADRSCRHHGCGHSRHCCKPHNRGRHKGHCKHKHKHHGHSRHGHRHDH